MGQPMTHSKGRGCLVPFNDDIQPPLAPGPRTEELHLPRVILSQQDHKLILLRWNQTHTIAEVMSVLSPALWTASDTQ